MVKILIILGVVLLCSIIRNTINYLFKYKDTRKFLNRLLCDICLIFFGYFIYWINNVYGVVKL